MTLVGCLVLPCDGGSCLQYRCSKDNKCNRDSRCIGVEVATEAAKEAADAEMAVEAMRGSRDGRCRK